MNGILYVIAAAFLFSAEVLYIRLAIRFRIIDKPNERSSHSRPTVRGGGVIFWLAALLAFVVEGFQNPYFFAGLTLIALVSFLDDVDSLPNRHRFVVQLIGVGLLFQELQLWQLTDFWWLPLLMLMGCGTLNAYNFMDGINGITAFYSFVTVGMLLYINRFVQPFTEPLLPVFTLISLAVFSFFNARRKALCFAGDVGSMSAGFMIMYLLISLMVQSETWIYALFLAVYGIDSGLTILHRLWLRENIFRPHKRHLFQVLVHRLNWSHVRVSGLYVLIQFLVNGVVLWLIRQEISVQISGSLILLLVLAVLYGFVKNRLLKQKPQTESVAAQAV
jgi:UDP-GlcNAc:undecaprenyl-phosphate GlcNAc-1-phosphate transferase